MAQKLFLWQQIVVIVQQIVKCEVRMKQMIIAFAVAAAIMGTARVHGGDALLFSVQTRQGPMISVAGVPDDSDATLQIGRFRLLLREVSDVQFTELPEHRINAGGDMYLVGPATVQMHTGQQFTGTLRIQTNRLPESPAYASITTTEGTTMQLSRVAARQAHTLHIDGKQVSLIDIRSIEYLDEPDFRISTDGEIYSLRDARIVTRDGLEHRVTLRGIDYWYGRSAQGLVVIPVEQIMAINFSERMALH